MRVLLLAFLLAAPAAAPTGPGAARDVAPPKSLERMDKPLTDDDVARFLRLWPAFEKAIDGASPPAPKEAGIEAAEAAWEADHRLEAILREAGATSDEFLRLYRHISGAWWSLLQEEERARTTSALERELAALEKVAGTDNPALTEMRSASEGREPAATAIPRGSLDAVARRRSELSKIFVGH